MRSRHRRQRNNEALKSLDFGMLKLIQSATFSFVFKKGKQMAEKMDMRSFLKRVGRGRLLESFSDPQL